MEIQPLRFLTLSLAVVSCLMTPSAYAQSNGLPANQPMQRSTCVTDTQGMMCKPTEQDDRPTQPTATPSPAGMLNAQQLDRVSDSLLFILYCVLPVGISLAVFLHDRHNDRRSKELSAQIARLERIWQQSPQA